VLVGGTSREDTAHRSRPSHTPGASTVVIAEPNARVIVKDPRARVIVKDPGVRVIVAPRVPHVPPVFVAPAPIPRWVPGYWAYQWLPHVSTAHVYVPGYFTADGLWVESHYEARVTQTGAYQPVWVQGYWAP
jgi:hypothetical protein